MATNGLLKEILRMHMNICNCQTSNLSELASEVLTHIASQLPIKAVKQLHTTCYHLHRITQQFINADTINALEKYILTRPAICSKIEIAKGFTNNTENKIQFLRDTICSQFFWPAAGKNEIVELDRHIDNSYNWSMCKNLEYKLTTQIVKIINNSSFIKCIYHHCYDNKLFISTMDVIGNNEMKPSSLEINFVKDDKIEIPLDKEILNLILKTLQKNKSICKLFLNANNWNPNDLKEILQVVKTKSRIIYGIISEVGNEFSTHKEREALSSHHSELDIIILHQIGMRVARHDISWTWFK